MPLPSDFLSTPYTPLVPREEPLSESKLPDDFLTGNSTAAARQNLHLTRDVQPQDVAPAKQVARQLDLDPETVLRNKQEAFAQARDMAVDYALQDSPGTAEWFAKDRLNAAQGRKEASVFAQLEKGISDLWARGEMAYEGGDISVELFRLGAAQARGDDSPETAAKIRELQAKMREVMPTDDANLLERFARATGSQIPIQGEILGASAEGALGGALVGGSVGALGGGPLAPATAGAGAAVGAGAGATAYTFNEAYDLELGSSFLEYVEAGMDVGTARWASNAYALIAAAIETVTVPIKAIPGVGQVVPTVAKMPVRATIKNAVMRFFVDSAKMQVGESGEEFVQTYAQDIVQQVFGGPDITAGETFRKAVDAFIDTMLVPLGPGMRAPQLGVDLYDVRQAKNTAKEYTRLLDVFRMQDESAAVDADMQRVDSWRQLALATELRQTDPAAFEALMQSQIDAHEDAVREVHVSGQALFQAMQAAPEEAQQILEATGLTQDEVITAADTGADVTIGLPQYLAHVAGTTVDAAVAQDMRIRPDGMTVNERDEWVKGSEEELTRLVSEAEEARVRNESWDEESVRIEDAVKNELMFANDPASNIVANQNAKIYSAFLTTLANRGWLRAYNNSPWQAFQAIWPTTQRGQAAGQMQTDVQMQALQQGTPDTNFSEFGDFTVEGRDLFLGGQKVGTVKIDVEMDHVSIRDIRVNQRGEGTGTAALQSIIQKAHAAGLPVTLTAETMQGKATQKRLRAYYERLGFVKNKGANKVAGSLDEYVLPAPPRMQGQPLSPEAQAMADRIAQALLPGGPVASAEVALPPTTLYQVQNLPEWKIKTRSWMEKNGYTAEEIGKHLAAIEGQMKIFAALGPMELEMLPQGAGLNPRSTSKGVPTEGPIRSNADPIYKITFDASAMCVKRLEAAATANYVQKQIGRALTTSERMALVALFRSAGKQAPCVYCYVEAPRAKSGEFVKTATDVALGLQETPKVDKGKKKGEEKWSQKTLDAAKAAQEEAKALGLKQGDIDPNVVLDPEYAQSDEAQAKLAEAPAVYGFLKMQMLNAKAYLPKLYEEYTGQILDLPQALLDELNGYAGLRFFSSSDFQAEHVADLMQAVFDMEVRQAKAHAYTKVPDFVRIFGGTGIKIQTSIFAQEKDGEIVMDDGQGMNWDEAKAFREQYPNVGTIIVASSDNIVQWALEQDWIDYIIPFHYSGLESKFYKTLQWEDFTSTQSESAIGEGKAQKIRMYETGSAAGISNEQGTRNYLTLAMERKLMPVFPAFLFKDFQPSGDRAADVRAAKARWEMMVAAGEIDWSQINPNYYKLRKDYARTDTPFDPVQANVDLAKAEEILNQFLSGNAPKAQVDPMIAERLMGMIRESETTGADIGVDALKAVQGGQTLFQSAWHGSPYRFTKFSLDHMGSGEGAQAYGWGLYMASLRDIAEFYRRALSTPKETVTFEDTGEVYELTNNGWAEQESGYQLDYDSAEALAAKILSQEYSTESIREMIDDGDGVVVNNTEFTNAAAEEALALIESGSITFKIDSGQLYKVEIPEDDVMLLWDRPLSEQPEKVREALKGVEGQSYQRWLESLDMMTVDNLMGVANSIDRNNVLEDEWDDFTTEQEKLDDIKDFFNTLRENDPESFDEYVGGFGFSDIQSGQGIYQQLTTAKGSDKAASMYLNSLGIKGIKYLDGTSRSAGEGSYNYVIFDDQTIQILETFYQQQERPNAMVQLTKGPSGTPLVTLFETANESSFLHESGHIFLNFLKSIAERADAPEDLKAMWADVSKEIGHAGGEISIESHEQWARALEAYFREGKSPSNKLIAVFQTFSAWLRRVYDDFWARGNKPSPELKALFDRLFATDAEIQETQARHEAAKPFFTEAELQASEDALRYERLRARANAAQHDTALSRLTKAYFKALGGQKQFKADAQAEADSLPVYRAIAAAVKSGGMNIPDIEALLGTEAKKRLVKRLQAGAARKEGGVDLDTLAQDHGYASAEAMLIEMMDSEKKSAYVARRMKEMMDEKAASLARGEAAREANLPEEDYHSEDRLAVLVAEAEMLQASLAGKERAQATKAKRIELQAVREVARRVLAGKPVSKAIAYAAFSRAELAAGKAARKAMAAGKTKEAEQHKRREMLNHALVLESIAARDRVAKQEKKIREAVKSKSATEEVRTLVGDIAARFGLQRRPPGMTLPQFVALHNSYLADQEKVVDFAAWQTARENEGYGVALPALVTDRANTQDYKSMPLEQFDEVAAAVEHIMHIDRRERQVMRDGKLVDLQDVVDDLIAQLEKTFDEKSEKRFESNKTLAKMKSAIFRGDASLMKMELLFRAIDGGEIGPWFRTLMDKVNKAAEQEDDRSAKAAQDVLDLMHKHYSATERNNMFGKRILVKEIGQSLTKAQILRVLMDFGNEGNYMRRRDGEGWTDEQMSALKKYADKRDWDYIQEVWDYIDTYRPEAFAVHKSLTGRTPERIVPVEVETPYGTYKGGYFPVVIDPKYSQTHAGRKELENALYETPNFSFVMTKHGHLKERMQSARGQALSFEMSDLTNHLYGVIHDITHREAVMDIAKIFRHKEFMAAVEKHLGKEYATVLVPWVKDIANTQAQPQVWLEKFFRAIRMGTTVARLAKIGVGLQQAVGITQTMGQLGVKESWRPVAKISKYLLTGGYAFTKDLAFANESSAFMRHRITSTTREATEAFRGLSVKDRYLKKPGQLMLKFLGACQKFCTDVPSWAAAYDLGLRKYGDHDQAVTYADHIVRVSQGSGQVKDLTEIQRSKSEAIKLMTMFYSFLSSAYAQLTDPLRGKKPHFGQFMWITTTLVILGPTLAELASGRPPEDDEEWETWAAMNSLKFSLSLVPGVKDVAGAALSGFGYSFSPVEAPVQSLVWLMRNAPEAIVEEEYERLFKPTLDVVGVWAALPSDQLFITGRAAYRLLEGDPSYDFVDLIYKRKKE